MPLLIILSTPHCIFYFIFCYSDIFLRGLSNVKLSLKFKGWDINNCIKLYLNINLGSKRSVNNTEELKPILNNNIKKLHKQNNMHIMLVWINDINLYINLGLFFLEEQSSIKTLFPGIIPWIFKHPIYTQCNWPLNFVGLLIHRSFQSTLEIKLTGAVQTCIV